MPVVIESIRRRAWPRIAGLKACCGTSRVSSAEVGLAGASSIIVDYSSLFVGTDGDRRRPEAPMRALIKRHRVRACEAAERRMALYRACQPHSGETSAQRPSMPNFSTRATCLRPSSAHRRVIMKPSSDACHRGGKAWRRKCASKLAGPRAERRSRLWREAGDIVRRGFGD